MERRHAARHPCAYRTRAGRARAGTHSAYRRYRPAGRRCRLAQPITADARARHNRGNLAASTPSRHATISARNSMPQTLAASSSARTSARQLRRSASRWPRRDCPARESPPAGAASRTPRAAATALCAASSRSTFTTNSGKPSVCSCRRRDEGSRRRGARQPAAMYSATSLLGKRIEQHLVAQPVQLQLLAQLLQRMLLGDDLREPETREPHHARAVPRRRAK